MPRQRLDKHALLADMQRVYKELGTLSMEEYDTYGKHTSGAVKCHFGSWRRGLELASIPQLPAGRHRQRKYKVKQCHRCDGPYRGKIADKTEIWCSRCRYAVHNGKWTPAEGWEYEHCGEEWRIA